MIMKIADFNAVPLMVKVRCDGKIYTLVDKIRGTHVAVLDGTGRSGFKRKVRCSEIELHEEE